MEYSYDIAHEYDLKCIEYLDGIFTPYLKNTIERTTVKGLKNLKEIPADNSVVLIGNHKSHLDYIKIRWVILHSGIISIEKPIAIAAGDNLFKKIGKWDFDKLVRRAGGYKIIRKPEPEKIVSTTKTQIRYLGDRMDKGDWFIVFPERSRSYLGEIKKYDSSAIGVFQKAERQAKRKVVYVPIAISDERVAEDRWFRAFNKYRNSTNRFKKIFYYALDWPLIFMQQYMTYICAKPLGNTTVSFGQPISCNGQDRNNLASRIENESKAMVKAYPTNILSAALIRNQDRSKINEGIMSIQEQLKIKGAISEILPPEKIIERASRFLNAPFRRFITKNLEIERGDVIRYYNNSITHFLD